MSDDSLACLSSRKSSRAYRRLRPLERSFRLLRGFRFFFSSRPVLSTTPPRLVYERGICYANQESTERNHSLTCREKCPVDVNYGGQRRALEIRRSLDIRARLRHKLSYVKETRRAETEGEQKEYECRSLDRLTL